MMKQSESKHDRKRVLFLANHFITLFSFRKAMIIEMVQQGYEVYLSLPDSEENQFFVDLGCHIVSTKIDRRGVNPMKDMELVNFYRKMIPQVDPDVIFSFTVKPNIYGALACRLIRRKDGSRYRQVCNITGTGATFLKKSVVSEIVKMLYRCSVKKSYKVFFQNTGDRDFFVENRMVGKNIAMLPGSGCDLQEHQYVEMPDEETTRFIFFGRVMAVKGVDEYLKAAQTICKKHPNTKFYIAGWIEEDEFKQKVDDAVKAGYIEYLGFRKDMQTWIEKTHCTILASHGGEGVPNVLLESAATGRACIASMINGSRDVVDDGVTGFLFETGNAEDLVRKVEAFLAMSHEEKVAMGKAGRVKIEQEFDRQIVVQKYLDEVEQA